MRTQSRLQTISTATSLFGMAMGFSALGFMIVVNQHGGGASIAGGILGILLGATFLIVACPHLTGCGQMQGGFRLEGIPTVEIAATSCRCNLGGPSEPLSEIGRRIPALGTDGYGGTIYLRRYGGSSRAWDGLSHGVFF
jgi:hypothetical protein